MTTPASPSNDLDVLIVGLGFSGTYLLHKLLALDYKVLAVDSADQLGGVWNHNIYPGARVDISVPSYQLNIPELYGNDAWEWSERFPSGEELRWYFAWVQEKLGMGRACEFGVWVEGAEWIENAGVWEVRAKDGRKWRAKWLLPCLGYAAAPYIPDFKGLETFKGEVFHSARWPKEVGELKGRSVGVIGTGASAVQIVQTIAPLVKTLTVLQRTPATAVPMQQRKLAKGELTKVSKNEQLAFFENRKSCWDGSPTTMMMRSAKADSATQREVEFERLWKEGGFAFWTSNYMDLFGDQESNDLIYDFWKRKVRSRIEGDPTRNTLAPETQPYAFGTKRVPLEQGYYEAFNRPSVSLIDVRDDPIQEIMADGILLKSGNLIEVDTLVLATGFDISTGSFTQLDIRGVNGQSLTEKWLRRTKSYLGMAISGFPNLLYSYGPQSPSNTCNGPVCAEIQGDWIIDLLDYAKKAGQDRFEVEQAAEDDYTDVVAGLLEGSLFEGTKAYYHRDNVPGADSRKREPVFWMGGLPAYAAKLEECAKAEYAGFNTSSS